MPSDYTVPGAVPPTSVDTLTAQSLADGVHLGWTSIATPAAGVESSIERSADGSTGWTERARVRSTAYTDPETSGTTYYYRVRYVNFAGQFGDYSPIASSNGVNVGSIGTNASNALADAAAAQADADAANAALADIASDGILSPVEKPTVIRDNSVILTEQAGIDAQATAYGITTEKTAYDGNVSALTSYLATLTTPVLWSDLSGNTTIVGTTFRSKFADVYTTRQALLNAIYAAAKAKADAAQGAADNAQGTANTAVGQVTQLPVINGGFDIAPTGYGWAADSGTWITDTTSISPGVQPNCARRNGSAGTPTDVYRNAGRMGVDVGQIVRAQALIKAVGANGNCAVRISWLNDSQSEMSVTQGNVVTGTTTAGSYVVGPAPSGARYARVELIANNHTAGYYLADNVLVTQYPKNVGEVPDGGGRYAVNQVDGNGLAIVDFSQSGHVNKTQSYIGDDANYRRVAASFTDTSNRPIGLYYGGLRTGDYFLARANGTGTQPLATISDAGALAGKSVANMDSDVVDGTNFRRIGSGYVDTSGRPYRLWNGSTIKEAADAVFSGDSLTRLGGRTLDNIADTSTFAKVRGGALYSGVPTGISFGNNLVANPSWSSNVAGFSSPVITTSTGIADGWKSSLNPVYHAIFRENASGSYSVAIKLLMGVTLPAASGYIEADAAMVGMFDVLASRQYRFRTTGSVGIAETPPAGVLTIYRSDVYWYRGDGTFISNSPQDANNPTAGTYNFDVILTPPAGAAKAAVVLSAFVNNTNASPVVTSATQAWFDARWYSVGVYLVANLDQEVADGPTYGRTSQNDLYVSGGVNRVGLRVAGSGHRLGDQRNTPSSLSRAYGAVRNVTALTVYSSGAVDVNAHTLTMGTAAINYNAVSNAVTGLTSGQTYMVYTRDNYAGGSPTWLTTQSAAIANSFDDAYIGGSITVPSTGSSGGGLPGGGGCVHVDAWLKPGLRAKDVRWWQRLDCAHRGRRYRRWQSWLARVRWEPCVKIVADGGASLACSIHTPFELRDGATTFARDMYGHEVLTEHGWRRVIDVIGVGIQPVMRIHVGGRSYAAGEDPTNRIYSHNPVK